MALAGVVLEFGFAGVAAGDDGVAVEILGAPVSSQNMTAPDTASTISAPRGRDGALNGAGQPVARVFAVADSWVAFGAVPDSTASPRCLVKAGTEIIRGVAPGDKMEYSVVA